MDFNKNSSIWVERYRPRSVKDLVAPKGTKTLLENIVRDQDLQHLIFYGTAGLGKTSAAKAIANDLGADVLYINGSKDTSIDTVRHDVTQFATTHSLVGGSVKIVILDECEQISMQGQNALKVILEETSSLCRFILCTNNVNKIIPPLHSRCKMISFNYGSKHTKEIMMAYFARTQEILINEQVEFDKGALAEFIQKVYPDFRKILNELQGYHKENGKIDKGVMSVADASYLGEMVDYLKGKKFNKVRGVCAEIDAATFYSTFYAEIRSHVQDQWMPECILILADYANRHTMTIDQEINLVACCTELMLKGQWK